MTIKIDDDLMILEFGAAVIATADRQPAGRLKVSRRPAFFDRNQAITAVAVTELLATGRDSDDPVAIALREELR